MKVLSTLFVLFIATVASAQWSNTTNQFYDSLHMPVSIAAQTQQHPIVVKSYPDSGYFVIWEDDRNTATTLTDIYAQKYDKNGNALWAINGVPVVNGPNSQHYYFGSSQDYRNRSFAATDSAGGFYIAYSDDSTTNYNWPRICVQHVSNNGSASFPGAGFIVAQTPSTDPNYTFSKAQLIADGNKGFYVSFSKDYNGANQIYIFCFRNENGTMQYYGGGIMDENAIERQDVQTCGDRTYIEYPATTVFDYNIWSDLQGGCNVVMNLNGNAGDQYQMLAYNKVWRAKKNSISTQYYRNTNNIAVPLITNYVKDSVYRLWFVKTDYQNIACSGGAYINTRLLQNGYQLVDGSYTSYNGGGYDYNYPKGTIISTSGNINVNLMAVLKRTYQNNTLSNFTVKGYGYRDEKYDSIPYQRASDSNPEIGYNAIPPSSINKLNNFRDTLLGEGNYFYDFSLAAGGNQIFSSAKVPTPSNGSPIWLQHLAVEQKTADSFAIEYKTSAKQGVMIGIDKGTCACNAGDFDLPLITVNNTGNALFFIREYQGPARVSPIINGAELAWGAMGRRVGSGVYNGGGYQYYSMEQSFVALDPLNGTGVIAWKDNRSIPGNTGDNIFMRHLDSLNLVNYSPPNKMVKLLPNPYGPSSAYAEVLLGTSKKYSTLEALSYIGGIYATTPVAAILDNYNLGKVQATVFQNTGTIRTYNGTPYLDRNFTIKPENNPAGTANINVRLFFTTAEFDALIPPNPIIGNPGSLVVIKQPNSGTSAPSTYTPITGEEVITPLGWAAVPGGYYLEIVVNGFSNFFIEKSSSTLPVTWLGIQAQWANTTQAKVSWQVAAQQNVKEYIVQHSVNGNAYTNVCTVTASNQTQYSCIVAAASEKNYYRVMELDNDGKITYSKVVLLQSGSQPALTIYPNPVKDKLYINGLNNYRSLQLTDANGKIIQKQNVVAGMQFINVNHLAPGMYALTIMGNIDSQTLKFIKN